ncbi:MAG TPA: Xaa-Pro peptidase family protein [Thermoleophilaceae bacterium]|jgi:Xaa-Pro aminopeptidase
MTEATLTARADRLLDLIGERELDCLLVTNLVNVRYLTGFTGTNGACLVTPEDRLFVTDFRYVEQAQEEVSGFELVKGERDLLAQLAKLLSGRAGFDDAHVTVRVHHKLSESTGEGVELVEAAGLVERLREVKDDGELRAIAAASELADEVYELLRERGSRGRTERELARELEQELRERGAEPSFPTIVASGEHGALPHAVPRDVAVEEGALMIVDMGALLDGYCSDCTRTFAIGEVGERAREVYDIVLGAQEASLEATRAGAACPEVDAVARDRIEAAGYGENFGHGLGHGVGLEVHEGPRLAKSAEGELRAGSVVTVEPGIYLPGELGVRIEDLVVVGDEGPDILSGFPKDLIRLD